MNAQCHGSRYGDFGVGSGELTVTEQVLLRYLEFSVYYSNLITSVHYDA